MQRWKVVGQVTALIVTAVALPALVWASSSPGQDPDKPGISRVHDQRHDEGQGHGHGPPPWAHGHHATLGKDAAKAWQQLTPEQRSALMRKLTTQHRKGMLAWEKCVAAARDDCTRPVPPGLAKRG